MEQCPDPSYKIVIYYKITIDIVFECLLSETLSGKSCLELILMVGCTVQ